MSRVEARQNRRDRGRGHNIETEAITTEARHLPPVRTSTHQLPDICNPERTALKILACLLFPGQRQSLVRVAVPIVFNSLPQAVISTDNISTFCRLLDTPYFRNAFDQH